MCLGAQVLKRMPLLGDGIGLGVIYHTYHLHRAGLNFDTLPLALRRDKLPRDYDGAAGGQRQHLGFIVSQRVGHNRLYRVKGGTIMDREERNTCLGIALTAQPTPNRYPATNRRFAAEKNRNCMNIRHLVGLTVQEWNGQ